VTSTSSPSRRPASPPRRSRSRRTAAPSAGSGCRRTRPVAAARQRRSWRCAGPSSPRYLDDGESDLHIDPAAARDRGLQINRQIMVGQPQPSGQQQVPHIRLPATPWTAPEQWARGYRCSERVCSSRIPCTTCGLFSRVHAVWSPSGPQDGGGEGGLHGSAPKATLSCPQFSARPMPRGRRRRCARRSSARYSRGAWAAGTRRQGRCRPSPSG
jgi:hypothetical protein